MENSAPIDVEIHGPVAILWLNRPDRRNAIDTAMTLALRAALANFESDSNLQVAILAGRGKIFCAGMDLKAFVSGEAAEILRGENRFAGFVAAPRKKPVIAAVHGAALAGGFELMLSCDMAVVTPDCKLGLPEVTRGLIAGAGGAFRLARRVPLPVAKEILLTGEAITADRALHFGLVNKVVSSHELLETTLDLARKIASNAPLSVQHSLTLANIAANSDEAALWEQNDILFAEIEASDDAQEGARAFTEKRAAVWSNGKSEVAFSEEKK